MTILRKRPLTAVALGALFVGAISCGTNPAASTQVVTPTPTPTPVPTPAPVALNVIKMTTGTDLLTGTAGNDFFDASFDVSSGAAVQTWNSSDVVNGDAGTDILSAQLNGTSVFANSFMNIEELDVQVLTAISTVDLSNADSSLTTIKNTGGSTFGLIVNNVPSAVANFGLADYSTAGAALTVTMLNTALVGTSDSATVTINNVSRGNLSAGPVTAGSGLETLNILSKGPIVNGTTGTLAFDDGAGNSLATVNVTGASDLTFSTTPTTVVTMDASAATGNITYTAAANNAQNMTIKGGTGADILNPNGFTTSDTINGGTGVDTLILTNAEAIAVTAVSTAVTNTEIVRVSDATTGTVITLTNLGATGLQLGSAVSEGNVLATYTAGTGTFDLQDSTDAGANTIALTMSGNATADIMNVTLGTTAAAPVWNGGGAFTVNGAETVNILSQGAANTISGTLALAPTAGTGAIVVTGGQNLTFTGAVTAGTVNASGMTGSGALVMTGGAGAVSSTITGTANADTLTGSSVLDTILGGAGNDTIQSAISGTSTFAANDSIMGGSGNDTFRIVGSSASAAILTGSAFISDFNVGLTSTTTDILDFDITSATYAAAGVVFAPGTGAIEVAAAAGTSGILQSVTASLTVAAACRIIKLATPLAFVTDINTTFQTAMAGITITLPTAAAATTDTTSVLLYDTTSARMLILAVTGLASTTTLTAAGTARLIGSVAMTAADFANFDSDNVSWTNY